MQLTEKQLITLRAIGNTLIPSLEGNPSDFWQRNAQDMQLAERLVELIGLQSEEEQQDFKLLLNLWASPFVSMVLVKKWTHFADLSPEMREYFLQKMAFSLVPDFRKGFQAIKKLMCFLFYTLAENGLPNPNWKAINYPGPLSAPPDCPKPIQTLTFEKDSVLDCEFLIIGSGAGGGTLAKMLAESGKDVLVVDKGGYFNEADFAQKEAEATFNLYEQHGMLATTDASCTVFAGSCLGGGTVINWSASLRTPPNILEEWAKEHQNPHFLTTDYQKSQDAVEYIFGVNTDVVRLNPQNQKLWDGSQKRNQSVHIIPQNIQAQGVTDPRGFGYSSLGCQYGHKQSTLKACLESAFGHGARFVVSTEIEKILIEQGKAVGAKAWQTKSDGQKIALRIRAKTVIVAAGSIHTPAILLRSGLQHPHIGQHLNLHPVLAVSAMYQEDMNPWWGMMMTTVNDQLAHSDGNFGVRIETPPVHSGLMALSLPWLSGRQHKQIMQNGKHIGSFVVLTRDRFGGRVILDKKGNAQIEYRINPYDRAHLLQGVAAATEIHLAAGAQKVMLPHHSYPAYDSNRKIAIKSVLKNLSWKPNLYSLFSAHQMASCRMGGNSKTHPLAPNGETYEVKNLFVADASAFPSCSGVNPMLSIQALAHYIGRNWVG